MKIKIWCPDNEDKESADEVELDSKLPDDPTEDQAWSFWFDVEWAVKEFAEADHPHSDCWERSTFHARVGDVLKIYEVSVEMEPTFYIAEQKKPKTKAVG